MNDKRLAAGRRPAARTLALSLLSRLPESSLGVLLILSVRTLGHSYAAAGGCSGVSAFAMALGGPVLGRAADRVGPSPVLAATGLTVALAALAFALLPEGVHLGVALALAAVLGFVQPPVAASARGAWRRIISGTAFDRVVRLDATLQELSFMIGPPIFVTIATLVGAQAGLVVGGAALGVIAVLFALLPEVREITPLVRPSGRRPALGVLARPGIRVLVSVSFMLGLVFGAIEIGVIQAAEAFGHPGFTGALLGVWGIGSIAVGLLAMRHPWRMSPVRRLRVWLLAATFLELPLVLMLSPAWLAFSLLIAGTPNAIIIGELYSQIPRFVSDHEVIEAFSLDLASMISGTGVGTILAGLAATVAGVRAPFVLAILVTAGASLFVHLRQRPLLAPQATTVGVA